MSALDPAQRSHLARLVGWWPMLSDLCFSDLVVYLPLQLDAEGGSVEGYVMVEHVRPSTSQTIYPTVLVGEVRTAEQRPLVAQAFDEGAVVEGLIDSAWLGEQIGVRAIPVRHRGQVIAVVTRESVSTRRATGELELTYADLFDRLGAMIAAGELPFDHEDDRVPGGPRVGDGVLVLDARRLVTYASPNAVSALSRSGYDGTVLGRRFEELGIRGDGPDPMALRRPVSYEVDTAADTVVSVRVIPLLEERRPTGALVLVRDVTDLRRRDRLLVSKDATIREIHHRVKNNLQTISSLLRIQGRRLVEPSAREAIEESVRRIRSIALVHEILSRDPGEDVPFVEILRPLLRMVEEALVSPDHPVRFTVTGDPGLVSSPTATSLAVVLNELLQNAVEHAYPAADGTPDGVGGDGVGGTVHLDLHNDGTRLAVEIVDDGVGLPEGFSLDGSSSLGLSIVQTLVTTELGGSIEVSSLGGPGARRGTRIVISVPLEPGGSTPETALDATQPPAAPGAGVT
jgi:two-component sensor histidine kinase